MSGDVLAGDAVTVYAPYGCRYDAIVSHQDDCGLWWVIFPDGATGLWPAGALKAKVSS